MAYTRTAGDDTRLVLHNLSGQPAEATLAPVSKTAPTVFKAIAHATDAGARLKDGKLTLPPYTTAVLKP